MPFWHKSTEAREEEDRLHWERIAAFKNELLALDPSSLTGDSRQPTCYTNHVLRLEQQGQREEARALLEEALKTCQTDTFLRLTAASFYVEWDDMDEALIQLGILAAIDPTNFNAHRKMAQLVTLRGQEALAQQLLEQGWEHYAKLLPRRERDAARQRYFNLSRPPST